MMRKLIIFLTIYTTLLFANSPLDRIFQQYYFSIYESGQCRENIVELIKFAREEGIDLHSANVLTITDKGFNNFGLVNAEFVREEGSRNPQYPDYGLKHLPGERNWFYHVILEHNGLIYDFDFGNEPVVMPVVDYFNKMFLIEKSKSEGGRHYLGEEYKLKYYNLHVQSALPLVRAYELRIKSPAGIEIRLREYLNSFIY